MKMERKWTPELAEMVYSCAVGWSQLFVQAQDVLREMDKRKIVPFDMYQKVHRIVQINELPKKYRKEQK